MIYEIRVGRNCIVSNDDSMVLDGYFYGEGYKINFISQRAGRKIDIFLIIILLQM